MLFKYQFKGEGKSMRFGMIHVAFAKRLLTSILGRWTDQLREEPGLSK